MQKPLIGITAGQVTNKDRPLAPTVQGQAHTYIDAIIRSGGVPVILPLTADAEVLEQLAMHIDGLLLAGGNDIDPQLYGEEPYPTSESISNLRDQSELTLLTSILKQNKPVLAICRGMQLLNVHHGGSLFQDIPTDIPGSLPHDTIGEPDDDPKHNAHNLRIETDSKLYRILSTETISANSYHHQAVRQLGTGLRVTGYSTQDNIIESIETDDDRFVIGVQAHPESILDALPTWERLFTAFIAQSSLAKTA